MKTKAIVSGIALSVLLGSLATLAGCPETPGGGDPITVTFEATCSYDDSALPDATVEVEDESCTTDANGECEMDLVEGTYDANVTHDSHPEHTMEITITQDTTVIEVHCGCSV